MATQVQFRGGTTTEHASFNGVAKEVTVDTTKQTLVVQDGSTNGGFPLLRENGTQSLITTGNISIDSDSSKLKLGADDDLEIYHNGTNNYIDSINGHIYLRVSSTENAIKCTQNGNVEISYDGTKKFETTSYGNLSAGQLRVSSSNATTPAFSVGDSGTGFYNSGSNAIGYSANGTQKWNINSTGDLRLVDNVKSTFGASDDLQIYHTGSNAFQINSTGNTLYQTAEHSFYNADASKMMAAFRSNEVELRYDNVKKFETRSDGALVSGALGINGQNTTHAANTLKIGHEGSGVHQLRAYGPDGSTNGKIQFNSSRSDGSNPKSITYSSGNLEFPDSQKIRMGDSEDLQIYHDGSNSYIQNGTGQLKIKGDNIRLRGYSVDEMQISTYVNGTVALAYDGVQKFETTANGALFSTGTAGTVKITGTATGTNVNSGDAGTYLQLQNLSTNANTFTSIQGVDGSGQGTNQIAFVNVADGTNQGQMVFSTRPASGSMTSALTLDSSQNATFAGTVTCTSLTETSDIALKTNIEPITNVLDKINQITGYKYDFTKSNSSSMGVIAQDVEKVFPELVHGEEGSKSLQYSGLIGALIESVKELSAKVAALESS